MLISSMKNTLADYDLAVQDQKVIDKMLIGDIFEKEKIELIPAVFAASGPSGVIERNAFDYIESCVLNTVKNIFMSWTACCCFCMAPARSTVWVPASIICFGKIRELTGPYLPVAIACDPHGNLCREYGRGRRFCALPRIPAYRHGSDLPACCPDALRSVETAEVDRSPHRKLPLILGGNRVCRRMNRAFDQPVYG